MKKNTSANALLSAALALALAEMACAGGGILATQSSTQNTPPTQAAPAPSDTPRSTSAPTTSPASQATAAGSQAATEAATSAPTAAATAAPLSGSLEVHGISSYVDSLQYYYVEGLVTNGTGKPIDQIELSLQLTDSSGKSVLQDDSGNPTTTVTFQPILDTIDSSETTPFSYWMSADGLDTTGWKAVVTIDSSEQATDLQRAQVVVENNLMTTASDGDVYLTGEVVNKSDQPAQISNFAGALLDASGNVAGTSSFQDVTRLLSPAGAPAGTDRSPFVIHIPGPVKPGGTPNFYMDANQGNPGDIDAAADIHLHLDTSFADANNDVYVVATVSNSGTNTMTVRVMSGLYDQDGKVLDGSSADAPINLAPGGSSPVPMYYFANLNGDADLIARVVSYTAQIDPYWTFSVNSDFVTLQASNVTTEIDGSSLTVKGDVTNTSSQALRSATVVITLRDADGNVLAADWALAEPNSGDFASKTTQSWSTTIALPTKVDPKSLKVDTIVQGDVAN